MKVYGREEVQLHTLLTLHSCTLCPNTISLPLFEVLTFLFLHNIPLATKLNSWLFHSLHILVSLFLWVMIFGQTYPHGLATLALHECVVSLTHHLLYPWGKCPEYQLNRRLDGPEICPGSPKEVKNLLTLSEPNLNYSFIYPGHRLPNTPTTLSQLPF